MRIPQVLLRPDQIRGFYSVLDEPEPNLAMALLGSARIMQARAKPASSDALDQLARVGREMTAKAGALLVVNDDIDRAHRVAADGVHLGQGDLPLALARRRTDLFIGVSTHNLAQLQRALADGADYVAFGPVFETRTKADPDPIVGLDALAVAVELAGKVPVVAIGGITLANAASVRASGAAAACVISAVNRAADVRSSARAIHKLWNEEPAKR